MFGNNAVHGSSAAFPLVRHHSDPVLHSSQSTLVPAMIGYPLSLLSQELLDSIVDWVSVSGDKQALKSLREVDRAFVDRCHTYLFQTLSLPLGKDNVLSRYSDLITTSPALASHVRGVELTGIDTHTHPWLSTDENSSFSKISQILSTSSFPPSRLTLRGNVARTGPAHVREPQSLQRWLSRTFPSNALVELELFRLADFPVQILRILSNLKILRFELVDPLQASSFYDDNVNQDTLGRPVEGQAFTIPTLEELRDAGSDQAVKSLLTAERMAGRPIVSLAKLKTLTIATFGSSNLAFVQELLDHTRHSVQELVLSEGRFSTLR